MLIASNYRSPLARFSPPTTRDYVSEDGRCGENDLIDIVILLL
jgi:hypothetical protein